MRDARSNRLALLAAFAVWVVISPALAAPHCEKPCKAETAACLRARCAGLAGKDRRACVERCRGLGGCAPIRTLAYVVTECRSDSRAIHQALHVRRGNCAPATVMDLELPTDLPEMSCRAYGDYPLGHLSVLAGVFQRLAVSPDGSGVIFEATTSRSPRSHAIWTCSRGQDSYRGPRMGASGAARSSPVRSTRPSTG